MTYQDLVAEFYREKAGRAAPHPREALAFIREEMKEVNLAYWEWASTGDARPLMKELADLVNVCYGQALAVGGDLDVAFLLVHESNMTKERTEVGKVQKGPDYVEPDMTPAFHEAFMKEQGQ